MKGYAFLATLALLFSSSLFADRIRCGNRLIGPGDSEMALNKHCPAPGSRSLYFDEAGDLVSSYLVQPRESDQVMRIDVVRGQVRRVERAGRR